MNYYQHRIGDFNNATRHLTKGERWFYRDMLELYYDTEQPLPLDIEEICWRVLARDPGEMKAVERVLRFFFKEFPDGWHHAICDEEIEKYHSHLKSSARGGRVRRKAPSTPLEVPLKAPSRPVEATTNQEPLTSSSLGISARDLEAKLREAAGWQNEPHPNLFVTGPIEALIASGAYLETDILPIISSRCRSAKPVGWNYFVGPIRDAMEARINASKPLNLNGNAANGPPQRNSRAHNFAILDAVIAEAQRREDGEGSGDGETVVISPA